MPFIENDVRRGKKFYIGEELSECAARMSGMNSVSGKRRNIVSRPRFFLAGLSYLLFRLSMIGLFGLLIWVLYQRGEGSAGELIALGICIVTLIVTGLLNLSNRRQVCCPLCRASLFMSPRSLVKPAGRKLLGSAKVPLAATLLTMPEVLPCPYCAEKVRLTRSVS